MKIRNTAGFTLVETLITISIAAILLAMGTSSYRYVTNSNRIAGEINGLLGDLQFARGEAIKEGRTVTACVSQDGQNCMTSTAWNSGWIVFQDPNGNATVDTAAGETVLRVRSPFSSTDTFTATNNVNAIRFNRQGYAVGIANGTLMQLHDATSNANWARCLIINLNGMMSSAKSGQTINTIQCT
jgi:type IV fimbrial biogenesis protein FimT